MIGRFLCRIGIHKLVRVRAFGVACVRQGCRYEEEFYYR